MRNVIQSRGRVRWIQDRRIACLPGWSGSRVSTAAITAPPQLLPFLYPEPPPPCLISLPATSDDQHGLPRLRACVQHKQSVQVEGEGVLVQHYPNEPRDRVSDWSILASEQGPKGSNPLSSSQLTLSYIPSSESLD